MTRRLRFEDLLGALRQVIWLGTASVTHLPANAFDLDMAIRVSTEVTQFQ
jgi:hypothetical protein